MYRKFTTALKKLHRSQQGMTGLETAIILIAFVTVASVLAYSVLSAGIFSAERGKETVYKGLESAQNTLKLQGSVLGFSSDNATLNQVQFAIGLSIPDQRLDTSSIIINYFDATTHSENVTATFTMSTQSTERGTASMLESDEQFITLVTVPAAADLDTYHNFTLQLIPPTGATLTITRTTHGSLTPVNDLK